MATRIQEILERIDKLKSSLQEKVVLLEERTRANEALKQQVSELEKERDDLSRKLEKSAGQPQRSEAFMAAERVEAITKLQREIQKAREQVYAMKKALREAGVDPKTVLGDDNRTPSPEVEGVSTGGADGDTSEQIEQLQTELAEARDQAAAVQMHLATRERELSHRDEELAAAHERAAELTNKLTEVENLLTTVRERSAPDVVAGAEELAAKDKRIAELEMEVARARQMTPPIDSEMEMPSVDDADAAEMMQLITVQQEQIQELTDKLTEVAEKDLALAELMSQIAELEAGLSEKDAVINELMEQVIGE